MRSTYARECVHMAPELIGVWRAVRTRKTHVLLALDRWPLRAQDGRARRGACERGRTSCGRVTAVGAVHPYDVRPTGSEGDEGAEQTAKDVPAQ